MPDTITDQNDTGQAGPGDARELAREWLRDLLANGERASSDDQADDADAARADARA